MPSSASSTVPTWTAPSGECPTPGVPPPGARCRFFTRVPELSLPNTLGTQAGTSARLPQVAGARLPGVHLSRKLRTWSSAGRLTLGLDCGRLRWRLTCWAWHLPWVKMFLCVGRGKAFGVALPPQGMPTSGGAPKPSELRVGARDPSPLHPGGEHPDRQWQLAFPDTPSLARGPCPEVLRKLNK